MGISVHSNAYIAMGQAPLNYLFYYTVRTEIVLIRERVCGAFLIVR